MTDYNGSGRHNEDGRPMLDEAQSQQSLGESMMSGEDSVVPDIQVLNLHCARAFPPRNNTPEAKEEAAASWEPVREWLRTRSAEEVRAAAEQRGDSAMTALHFACRNAPPTGEFLKTIWVWVCCSADVWSNRKLAHFSFPGRIRCN